MKANRTASTKRTAEESRRLLESAAAEWAFMAESLRNADSPDNNRRGKIRAFQSMVVVKLQEAANA